jgi:hypothetical protein
MPYTVNCDAGICVLVLWVVCVLLGCGVLIGCILVEAEPVPRLEYSEPESGPLTPDQEIPHQP